MSPTIGTPRRGSKSAHSSLRASSACKWRPRALAQSIVGPGFEAAGQGVCRLTFPCSAIGRKWRLAAAVPAFRRHGRGGIGLDAGEICTVWHIVCTNLPDSAARRNSPGTRGDLAP